MTHQCPDHHLPHRAPQCPRCGSRLFLEEESWDRRRFYYWYCATGCSRQYPLGMGCNGNGQHALPSAIPEQQPVYV